MWGAALVLGAAAAAPVIGPVAGETRIAPGLTAHYEYHYDRNAIRESRRSGDSLVALTEAGNVIWFAGDPLKPVKEVIDPFPATALGGGVQVGYRDGRLVNFDGYGRQQARVERVNAEILWIGWHNGAPHVSSGPVVLVGLKNWKTELRDLSNSWVHEIEERPSALLVDSQNRLWMGADRGEWGGWCRVLDLETFGAKPRPCGGEKEQWDGVYGFIEIVGQVWAYGGLSHMGANLGYIKRVDAPGVSASFGSLDRSRTPSATQPNGPVTFITGSDNAGFNTLVLSFSDAYLTDRKLRGWRKYHTLKIHYRWGRPDAMGAYPSIRGVHIFRDGTLMFATRVDGYVRLRAGVETPMTLAGQLGARSIDGIESTPEGPLFIERSTSDTAWRLAAGGWQPANVAPPFDPHPMEPKPIPPDTDWYETKILTVANGDVVTVNHSRFSPGTVTTAAWRQGRAVVLGREISDLYLGQTFATPDGQLWSIRDKELKRFEKGGWHLAGSVSAPPIDDTGIEMSNDLRAIPGGPPWIILDQGKNVLLTLAPGTGNRDARVTRREVKDARGKPRLVHDAIPWSGRELLLATDAGPALYTPATGKLAAAPFATPPRPIRRLFKDRLGRLWLGGDGLWMIDGRRSPLRSFDALPMIAGSEVEVIGADSEPDGVTVSLGARGVVRLRLRAD